MDSNSKRNRIRNFIPTARFASNELALRPSNTEAAPKPARITRPQVAAVLSLVKRVAAGGDATTAVDAAACIPLLEGALRAAPAGHRAARKEYECRLPDGTVQRVQGLQAVARLAGKVHGTVANAISRGGGVAEFPCCDALGNPARIFIRRLA